MIARIVTFPKMTLVMASCQRLDTSLSSNRPARDGLGKVVLRRYENPAILSGALLRPNHDRPKQAQCGTVMLRQLGDTSVRVVLVGRAIGRYKGNFTVLPEVLESRLAPVHEQPHHPIVPIFGKDY